MWESPIRVVEQVQDAFVEKLKRETEEMVYRETRKVGIEVDKEELVKALMYDRNQYDKGYKDGYNEAIDEFVNKLCEHCMQQTNECYKLECPFCTDGCDIINIAEQMKGV